MTRTQKLTQVFAAMTVSVLTVALLAGRPPIASAHPIRPPRPPFDNVATGSALPGAAAIVTGSAAVGSPLGLGAGSVVTGSGFLGTGSGALGAGSAAVGSSAPAIGSAVLGLGLMSGGSAQASGLGTGSALLPCSGSAAAGSALTGSGLTGFVLSGTGSGLGSAVVGSAATGSALLACLLLLPGIPAPAPGIPLLPGVPVAPVPVIVVRSAVVPRMTPESGSQPPLPHRPDRVRTVVSIAGPVAWNVTELVTLMVVIVIAGGASAAVRRYRSGKVQAQGIQSSREQQ